MYPNGDYGAYVAQTDRGSNWQSLSAPQKAALQQELAGSNYVGLTQAEKLHRLIDVPITGSYTRQVMVTSISKDALIQAAGFMAWGKLLAHKSDNATAGALLAYLDQRTSLDPSDPTFGPTLQTLVPSVLAQSDVDRLTALATRAETVPDAERQRGQSRQEVLGLGGLLLTLDDLTEAGVN